MLNMRQFREFVLRPTLKFLDPEIPYSDAAVNLLMATAAHESRFVYLRQVGGGPALGLFQIEPATEQDNWENYLEYRGALRKKIDQLSGVMSLDLVGNLPYQVAMARIKYWRDPAPMPADDDAEAQAGLWKRVYNTPGGAGTVSQFMSDYPREQML